MKKYVWSETRVEGGKPFNGDAGASAGEYRCFSERGHSRLSWRRRARQKMPQFYADTAVVAYRAPAEDVPVNPLHAKITASGGSPDFAMLSDGDLEKTTGLAIPEKVGETAWIQYEFPQPQTIRRSAM